MGMWRALRDVLIASLDMGQFPLAILGGVLAVIAWRLPPEALSAIVNRFLDWSQSYGVLGWMIALGLALAWFIHSRWQRRTIEQEMSRIADERTRWQEKALETSLGSSEGT